MCVSLLESVICREVNVFVRAGAHSTECRDCYFMMAVDVSFTGEELHFEAVGESSTGSLGRTFGLIQRQILFWMIPIVR